MGYLTTFTVYNDGSDLVEPNANEFAKKIKCACDNYETTEIALGHFCNLVKAQKPRHADDNTVYVHMGNSVFEMNPYSEEAKKMFKINPEFFKRAVNFLEQRVEMLKEMINE